jgi:hypothetical protein
MVDTINSNGSKADRSGDSMAEDFCGGISDVGVD